MIYFLSMVKVRVVNGSNGMRWLGRNYPKENRIEINPRITRRSDRTLVIRHERTEMPLRKKGMPYETAHRKAIKAEKRLARKMGVNWPAYCKRMDNLYRRIKRKER